MKKYFIRFLLLMSIAAKSVTIYALPPLKFNKFTLKDIFLPVTNVKDKELPASPVQKLIQKERETVVYPGLSKYKEEKEKIALKNYQLGEAYNKARERTLKREFLEKQVERDYVNKIIRKIDGLLKNR